MANRLLFWTGYGNVFGRTADSQNPRYEPPSDAAFAEMKARGIDAIVCQTGYFSAEDTIGQRAIDINGARRAKAQGIDTYLGFYAAPYADTIAGHRYPFGAQWDNDSSWNTVKATLNNYGRLAKLYGMAGLGQDNEDYPGAPGTAEFDWGVTATRAKLRQRGAEGMQAMVDGFGSGLEVFTYFANYPGSTEDIDRADYARSIGETPGNWWNGCWVDYWIGAFTSAANFARWQHFDAWFYKGTPGPSSPPWNQRIPEAAGRFNDFWLHGGQGAGSAPSPPTLPFTGLTPAQFAKIGWGNFSWVDGVPGKTSFYEVPMSVQTAADALAACRDYSTGEMIPVYAFTGLTNTAGQLDQTFDYRPYIPAMQAASGGSAPPPPPPPPPPGGSMQTVIINSIARTFPPPFTVAHSAAVDIGDVSTLRMRLKIPASLAPGVTQVLSGKGSPAGVTPAIEGDTAGGARLVYYGYNTGATVKSSVLLPVNTEVIVHFVSGPGIKKVYIDGVDRSLSPSATAAFQKTTNGLAVGSDTGEVEGKFTGTMRDYSIFDKTMTAAEVQADVAALSPPPADTTPPETTLTKTSEASQATFTFTSSETGSTFEGRLDGGTWGAVTSPTTLSGLTAGSHTYEVRGKDAAGNVDATPASVTWTAGSDPNQIATLTAERDQARSERDALQVKINNAKAALA